MDTVEYQLILITLFTINTETPNLLIILVLKFEIVHSTTSWCVQNIAVCFANSVDPDQMPHSAASDLGPHCLQRSIGPNTKCLLPYLKYW